MKLGKPVWKSGAVLPMNWNSFVGTVKSATGITALPGDAGKYCARWSLK